MPQGNENMPQRHETEPQGHETMKLKPVGVWTKYLMISCLRHRMADRLRKMAWSERQMSSKLRDGNPIEEKKQFQGIKQQLSQYDADIKKCNDEIAKIYGEIAERMGEKRDEMETNKGDDEIPEGWEEITRDEA